MFINIKAEHSSCMKMTLLSAPMKGRSQGYVSLHFDEYGHPRTWKICNACKTLYSDRSHVIFLVYLENEQPIIQINLETQHQHMHSHREHTGGANWLWRKNRWWRLHSQTLGNRSKSHGSSEMTIINECPVSQWHAKEPLLLNGHECPACINICSPSPAMVTSPYEWKILEWNEQTSKQTDNIDFIDIDLLGVISLNWVSYRSGNSCRCIFKRSEFKIWHFSQVSETENLTLLNHVFYTFFIISECLLLLYTFQTFILWNF